MLSLIDYKFILCRSYFQDPNLAQSLGFSEFLYTLIITLISLFYFGKAWPDELSDFAQVTL